MESYECYVRFGKSAESCTSKICVVLSQIQSVPEFVELKRLESIRERSVADGEENRLPGNLMR